MTLGERFWVYERGCCTSQVDLFVYDFSVLEIFPQLKLSIIMLKNVEAELSFVLWLTQYTTEFVLFSLLQKTVGGYTYCPPLQAKRKN